MSQVWHQLFDEFQVETIYSSTDVYYSVLVAGKRILIDIFDLDLVLDLGNWHFTNLGYLESNGTFLIDLVAMRVNRNMPYKVVTFRDANVLNYRRSNIYLIGNNDYKWVTLGNSEWVVKIPIDDALLFIGSYNDIGQALEAADCVMYKLYGDELADSDYNLPYRIPPLNYQEELNRLRYYSCKYMRVFKCKIITANITTHGWKVKIKHRGKDYIFGTFTSSVLAAQVADSIARELKGDNINYNFSSISNLEDLPISSYLINRVQEIKHMQGSK